MSLFGLKSSLGGMKNKNRIPENRFYEPAHDIMALFVLRKFILQTGMRSHPVGLDV